MMFFSIKCNFKNEKIHFSGLSCTQSTRVHSDVFMLYSIFTIFYSFISAYGDNCFPFAGQRSMCIRSVQAAAGGVAEPGAPSPRRSTDPEVFAPGRAGHNPGQNV